MLINPHVDSTCTHWPNSQQLKEHLSFPLALALQPFANEHPLSTIPADSISDFRCQSCKGFINQLCFIRNEHQYDCALCGCTNYLSQPIDIGRLQLNSLSYRVAAPSRQRILASKERLAVFVLDLTNHGPQSKEYLLYSMHLIKQFIINLHENCIEMSILLLGFDTAVHRFTLSSEDPARYLSYGRHAEGDDLYFPQAQQLIAHSINNFQNIYTIINQIEDNVNKGQLRGGSGESLLQCLKLSLRLSKGYSGKIIMVTGIKEQTHEFKQKMSKFYYDAGEKHSFLTNRKECMKGELQKLLQDTQMSLYFYIINSEFVNLMPFHVMSKQTNGQLRHYFPNQNLQLFHDLKQNLQSLLDEDTGYESLLKVRYSTGVKLVGIFGNFRSTKVIDQVDLLTCPANRRYLFEFCIQGRITSDLVVVQFSTLYTHRSGGRFFIIETHSVRVTASPREILENIDYINVNLSYVRGIVHNLDASTNLRNIQIGIQERCRKHINAIRELAKQGLNQQGKDSFSLFQLKRAKPYIIITFLMMKHFLLNQQYTNILLFDLNTQLRSKISIYENCINVIWPLVYAINEHGWQMTEMQQHNIPKATVAIFIDRSDQYYCYITNPKLQAQLKTANAKQLLNDMIQKEQALQQLRKLVSYVKQQKGVQYVDILPIQELRELKILDIGGQYGFDKFISVLINQ